MEKLHLDKKTRTGYPRMPTAFHVEDAYCRDCDEEQIYMDIKEEPSVYKIGARCGGCDRDYGVLERVSRSDVDHTDEVWERAESAVQDYLECKH